ncbi:MAG TPA: ElyC/SanA/YdcF family protein [Holophagaceae bacterium]
MNLFTLQKTLGLLAMPAGLFWLLLGATGFLCLRRNQRLAGWTLCGLALIYALIGNIYVGSALMTRLEAGVPAVDLARLAPMDAVFVLGGGTEQDPFGGPQLGQAGDRVLLAARLWHAGKARILVASGMSRDSATGKVRDLGQETRQLWRDLGIPDSAIRVVATPCWNTREEIAADRALQQREGWSRIGLLTSAWHLARARALAKRAGLEAIPLGSDWQGRPHPFQVQMLVPQSQGFEQVQKACWEWLGRRAGR